MEATREPAPAQPARPLLTVSEKARVKAVELLARHGKTDHGLRVGVRGGGCSGLTYFVEFENEARKGDHVLELEGVRIYLDLKSQLFLAGTQLEYTESLMDTGFKFYNPNAKRSCSCGESFTV